MVASALQLATRAFVRTLLALATHYAVNVEVNGDCPAAQLLSAYRRVRAKFASGLLAHRVAQDARRFGQGSHNVNSRSTPRTHVSEHAL